MNCLSLFQEQKEDFWMPLDEYNQVGLIFQGKAFLKNHKTRKWDQCHLELFAERLVRLPQSDYCQINACLLKKIKYQESSFQAYKHGFRLQSGKHKDEFFVENQDQYDRWFQVLKRYTLLPKFSKKYKIINKIKIMEYFPGYSIKVLRSFDNLYFQARIVEKASLADDLILKEIQVLRRLDHVYVQHLQEVYEDEQYLYLVFDQYAGRELKYILPALLQSDERIIVEFMYKLLLGVHHIHKNGIFHRDIKFDNIFNRFPDSLTDICLVNFHNADFYDLKNHKRFGTPGFMAPEIFLTRQYDAKVDIFSCGIIFYFIVYGKMPFGDSFNEILQRNELCDIHYPANCKISQSGRQLMKMMLERDPQKRVSSFQAINHHWFINMQVRDLLGKPNINKMPASIVNLSVIMEKSDIMDISNMSIHQKPHKQEVQQQFKIGVFEEEFVFETVHEKMLQLNQFVKHPSRKFIKQ